MNVSLYFQKVHQVIENTLHVYACVWVCLCSCVYHTDTQDLQILTAVETNLHSKRLMDLKAPIQAGTHT